MTNTDKAILDKAKTAIKYLRGYPDYDVPKGAFDALEAEVEMLGKSLREICGALVGKKETKGG